MLKLCCKRRVKRDFNYKIMDGDYMKKMIIEGNKKLTGTIKISGAKNSSVALIPASLLADSDVTICNIPEITDTDVLCEILNHLGVDVRRASESMVITPNKIDNRVIPKELTSRLRA